MAVIPAPIRQRVAKLRTEIEHHRYLYHVLDRPEISEAALDSLKHELADFERQYPVLVTPDSPTQRVAGAPLPDLEKVKHDTRMVSLEDVFSMSELEQWEKRWQKLVPERSSAYLVDFKLDGLAVSIVYDHGLLVRGATRGDGVTGEEVTQNVRTIESVPLRLATHRVSPAVRRLVSGGRVELRGEIVMLKRNFKELNARQLRAGSPEFANPRNVAAGSIRQLDAKLAAERKLTFYAWELVTDLGQATLSAGYEVLKLLGVKVNPYSRVCATLAEVEAIHADVFRRREQLDFWIDGLVVKVDDRALYKRLGIVGKAPRAAAAYKFPAEQVTTIVEDIQIQVGRTGVLTPVAHLRQVQVAGTTVSRATLHNANEIQRLDVRIGDTVILQKAGDIIPDIMQVLVNLRPDHTRVFRMPSHCPVCRSVVRRAENEVAHYCSNLHCPAREREGFYHLASKKAFDIDGLGPSTLDVLIDEKLVREPADIFQLRMEQLIGLPLFAETKAKNLMASIKAAKTITLDRFIYALGIRHIGEQTAIDLAHHFRAMDAFMRADLAVLAFVPNIGDVVAKSIAHYFSLEKNQQRVQRLLDQVHVLPAPTASSSALTGRIVVVTGSLVSMSREEAHAKIRAAGGTVGASVGSSTSLLVVGDRPGSKLKAAAKHGVKVVSEAEFLDMLQ